MSRFNVRKVAVLGAGVMGAQIAAQLVNLKVPVVLFDLPAKEGPKNGIVLNAIANLKKLKPSPIGVAADADLIEPANYEDDLKKLKGCDLVIEAIAERMDWKSDLYHKIAASVGKNAILASNTSGLSITELSQALPEQLRPRFCGIHFFNPPRYMHLVELIATPTTEPGVLDQLEAFVTSGLGKGVVRAKDTPNFIANRIGIGNMLMTMQEVQRYGLTYDVVDDLTGKRLGRASSGTFRTADVVGLDTLGHVIKTQQGKLSLDADPFYAAFSTPADLAKLIELGNLGQKTKAGYFKKVGREVLRFDLKSGSYVPAGAKANAVYGRMLQRPAAERLKLLRESTGAEGQFLWAILRNGFHYAAVHLQSIAHTARDVDQAMRWGFGMQQGPFELWQEAGWLEVAQMVQADIDAGKAICKAPLPDWVFKGPVAEAGGVHTDKGSWNPGTGQFEPRRTLPVYQRQIFPELLLGEGGPRAIGAGKTVFEDKAIRVWTLDDEVLIASLKTKMHVISPQVAEGFAKALDAAESEYQGLVIWPGSEPFSVGADLESMLPGYVAGGADLVGSMEQELQEMMLRVRYAQVPVVAAIRGMALGGGCELSVHCARRVAHLESYMGLVEVGVGLVPGGGGLAYIARRAAENAQASTGKDLLPFLTEGFTAAAMAKVGTSAIESRQLGYLQWSDVIVPHKDEVLHVAISEAKTMHQAGWRAPLKRLFPVAGRDGKATILGQLVNMRDGGFISAHDFHIASLIAGVLTGGDVDAGTLVNEEYLMALERQAFTGLLGHPKTQARIMGMLATGKPVRN
ncbi:MAG: enoyl-CoA hydratase/isomerase family protein [Burkholderiaceae bacterium]|nr:enoyl-CoA hydratase/isomerase family protein [Pseudomonadota bacterium]MBS0598911.1 enoyl-CoA hydratase/isomerase family protein [Pseudomonadota bacterium]MCO5117324.1 3-hydroxyacyl-CoA dehydrogenase/enoyl-CoA hydratase family protein [Burkholderiaceae bacterium]MCP5217745.1 enoyl-CoA hydratase/isomerase family protein [Burkholderiaceae bacterium]